MLGKTDLGPGARTDVVGVAILFTISLSLPRDKDMGPEADYNIEKAISLAGLTVTVWAPELNPLSARL